MKNHINLVVNFIAADLYILTLAGCKLIIHF